MKFSVCIPTYNRAYLIKKPLDSLANQTFKDFEVLVVDDGSTDNTEKVVKEYERLLDIKYIKKPNGGKHTALNTSLDYAKGELWIILDSDDEFVNTTLERMSDIWDKYKSDSSICGIMGRSSENGKLKGDPFDNGQEYISYVDFHFGKKAGSYIDCCECIKTSLINEYRWPENLKTKFVPENYVTDQLGLNHKLVVTNSIFKKICYNQDGITLNAEDHIRKNLHGYLFNAVSKVEDILPYSKKKEMTFRSKIGIWQSYWYLREMDSQGNGPRVKRITALGLFTYLYMNFRSFIRKHVR